jgi:hypothetical protein
MIKFFLCLSARFHLRAVDPPLVFIANVPAPDYSTLSRRAGNLSIENTDSI